MEKRNLDIKKSEKFCLCTWEIGKIRKLKGATGSVLIAGSLESIAPKMSRKNTGVDALSFIFI